MGPENNSITIGTNLSEITTDKDENFEGVYGVYGAFFTLLLVVAGISCYAKRQLSKRGFVNPTNSSAGGIIIFKEHWFQKNKTLNLILVLKYSATKRMRLFGASKTLSGMALQLLFLCLFFYFD